MKMNEINIQYGNNPDAIKIENAKRKFIEHLKPLGFYEDIIKAIEKDLIIRFVYNESKGVMIIDPRKIHLIPHKNRLKIYDLINSNNAKLVIGN